jgi:DNA helicase-2/ATP-dependent DNA helicase PcrA
MARRITLSPRSPSPAPEDLTLDYRAALNAQQHAAATAGPGAHLVVAGAGTGKTRTLIYRVAYLVETGTPPEQIVLLTFTRRAAREMTGRAAALLDGRCRRVQGGTFHAFCVGLLRRHATALGFPRTFTVLDAADAADVLAVLRTEGGYHRRDERFPKKRTLYNVFSAATNRQRTLADVLAERYPQYTHLHDDLAEIRRAYDAYKREHALMDFDDLLLRALELFDADDAIRRQIAAGCKHVLVDEYQDTNALQARLVERLASVHGNVMVVGDDAQSIYRFRGADFRNIFRFPEQFPGATVLKLEQNYRSTQPILDLANHVIRQAERAYDKTLTAAAPEADRAEADPPAVVPAPDGQIEATFVAQMVLRLREDGVPLDRLAVLFRSSHHAYDLEVELGRRNIPFVKYGGLKLSEAAHIKDVLAHLKVAENPQDAAAWNRVLQLLHGIGPKTARDLIQWATSAADDPFVVEDGGPFSRRYLADLKRLFQTLRAVRQPEARLAEQVEAVLTYYQPILEATYPDDYPKREPDLEHLVGLAEGYDSRTAFLSSLALDPIELTALEQEGAEADEPPLVLSTIHSAKGLEFHTVFLLRALEGALPSRYALKEEGGLDEELRLLYVAITRAETDLFISYPLTQYRRFQGEYLTQPSRFIQDVPAHLLEPVELVMDADAPPPALDAAPHAPAALPAPDAPSDGDAAGGDAAGGDAAGGDAAPSSARTGEPNDGLPF